MSPQNTPHAPAFRVAGLTELDRLALAFAELASEAGRAIMDIYGRDFAVRTKADASPVSEADEAAEPILISGVEKLLPGVPIVAEESVNRDGLPMVGETYVLIDPLDGTKEFINRNGEFTVNVALVRNGRPIVGCVYAPAAARMYTGGETARLAAVVPGARVADTDGRAIATRAYPKPGLTAVTSRSHTDERTQTFLGRLPLAGQRDAGSSLKFCLVAEGQADVYPRFGPTMEWDTAAGHAVLRAAGGRVLTPEGTEFLYGKMAEGFRNGAFIAWGGAPHLG